MCQLLFYSKHHLLSVTDFHISEAQYKHALAVEYLAPRLAALRYELCPVHMGVGYFWMVYFVLLHSRLNKHDAGLLSSPQVGSDYCIKGISCAFRF